MMTIPDITHDTKLNDLFDMSNCVLHIQYLADNITQLRVYEALQMTRFYEPWFKQHHTFASAFPSQYKQLMQLVIDNKWIAFNMLPQAETIELLHGHILSLFTLPQRYSFSWDYTDLPEFTLGEQMRVNILRIADLEARDYYKVQLSVALKTNQEIITTAAFFTAIKQVSPTLELWFQEYLRALGPHSDSSEFLLSEFLHKSEQGIKLDVTERRRLELIFKLYHRLVRSSWTLEGIEEKFTYESENQAGVLQYGELIPYDKTTMQTIIELAQKDTSASATPRPPVGRITIKGAKTAVVVGPDVNATKGPDHFTDTDEAEIQRHEEEVAALAKPTKSEADYLQVASDIKQSVALAFATPEQDKRFTDLIVSVLRGLRDTMELKEYLVDLSFPTSDADAVVAAVNQQIVVTPKLVSDRRAGKIPAPKLAGKPTLAQITKTTDLSPVPSLAREGWPEAGERSVKKEGTGERSTFLPKLRRSRTLKRQIVDDVRLQPSMVMGPIDELRAMDILEFRRLSPDPNQAAARLRDKVQLLAEESIAKQAQGVDAFKQSPLNMLYLALGNESIASGKAVTDMIAEHAAKGTPSLSVIEFNAIADLNKQLRF